MRKIVFGASSGAVFGGLVGGFAIALPGVGWSLLAMTVGMALGGYAGAVIGSLFGTEPA